MCAHLGHQRRPPGRDLLTNVVQHHFLRHRVEHNLSARRQKRKTLLELSHQILAVQPGQRPEPSIETKLAPLMPNEIQRGQHRFAVGQPQPTTQLLQKHGCALGRPQKQHRVHLRNI
jgi:hypothetical protein